MNTNLEALKKAVEELEKMKGDVDIQVDLGGFNVPIVGIGIKTCRTCEEPHPILIMETHARMKLSDGKDPLPI